jgi:hypothetical protein
LALLAGVDRAMDPSGGDPPEGVRLSRAR